LKRELDRQVRQVEQAMAARELHRLADQIRLLSADETLPPATLNWLEDSCRQLWGRRESIAGRLGHDLEAPSREEIRADLLDLAILWADLRVRQAPATRDRAARTAAVQVLDQAEELLGSSAVLRQERRRHKAALGLADATGGRDDPPPRTAWDHYALGRSLLRSGQPESAFAPLSRAVDLEPKGLWPNYYLGLCAYRLGRYQKAVMAFSTCLGVVPEAGVFHNRALALAALGCTDEALHDYDHALELDPCLAPAALNRGLLHFRAGRHPEALRDLRQALTLGADPAAVHYNLALVYLAQHDRQAARDSVARALAANPEHAEARRLRDELRQP
jgi:tetratricopeptide (TPR) repeat protein